MVGDALLGALAGGTSGVVGAFVAAAAQYRARRMRNRILSRRGEPGMKDVVWRPMPIPFGGSGAVLGAAAGAALGDPLISAAAGAPLPLMVALSSIAIVLSARR